MTATSRSVAQAATSGLLGRLVRRFGIWACRAAIRWERRAASKTLQELSDYELRDIGLERCDIESAVRGNFHPEMGRLWPEPPARRRQRGG